MMNSNPSQFGGSFQPPPQAQQKGCIGRHWKWMLPVGCLGLVVGAVALIGGIVLVAMSAIKSSEVYKGALGVAQTHPAAAERLGQPIKDGWLVQGNINYGAGGGNANFDIPVSGPKNSGTLHVSAVNPDGAWMYQKLDLVVGGETVSLLDRNVALPGLGSEVDVEEDADDGTEAGEDVGDEDAATPAAPGGLDAVLDDKALSKPAPPYPPAARAARASGKVTVLVLVDETGKVTSATAVSGHPLLRPAAAAAARQARFAPRVEDGKPAEFGGVLTYNFVLDQQ